MPALAGRRQPRQARARAKVERILVAARELLVAEGAEAFNTNRVAELAGVGVGSLYEYFPNKQAIVARLIESLSAQETDAILACFAATAELGADEAIEALVAAVFALYRRHHALYRALWAMADRPREIGHRPAERQVMQQVRQRVAELGSSAPALAAFTVFHLVEALCDRFAAEGVRRFGVRACEREIILAVRRYLGLAERRGSAAAQR